MRHGESPREGIIIERRGGGGLRKKQNEDIDITYL